jgi:hypothetical protein
MLRDRFLGGNCESRELHVDSVFGNFYLYSVCLRQNECIFNLYTVLKICFY